MFLAALMIGAHLVVRQALGWGLAEFWLGDFSFVPETALQPSALPRYVTHLFMHLDPVHLVSNLLFLAVFGTMIERRIGPWMWLAGFFVWGAAAALTQAILAGGPGGLIGASGALSGAAGACFVTAPLARKEGEKRSYGWVPVFLWVGAWYVIQIVSGMQSWFSYPGDVHPIAHWAHVGGFVAGALSAIPLIEKRSFS